MNGFSQGHSLCSRSRVVRSAASGPTRTSRRVTIMFETNQSPSFPAHQYLISGTSTIADGSVLRASENPFTPTHNPTGGSIRRWDRPSNS